MKDERLTGRIKRKHLSPSPVKSLKLPKYDIPAAKVLNLMSASSLDKADSFSAEQSQPKQKFSNPSFVAADSACFSFEKDEAKVNKKKPLSTRARMLKEKREAEAKKREEAAQKKITDWLRNSAQRMEEKKVELAQLQAMRKMKED